MTGSELAGGAVIELVERHAGDRRPADGPESLIVPNELRINGRPVYASYDTPVRIQVDGSGVCPLVVTVRLQCRVLEVGDAEPVEDLPETGRRIRAAVVRIPPAEQGQAPYAVINDQKVLLGGFAVVTPLTNGGDADLRVLEVTLPLLCRRLLVDDEPDAVGGPISKPVWPELAASL